MVDTTEIRVGDIAPPGSDQAGSYQRWFNTDPPMQPLRSNNSVTSLIDGDATFRSMVAAMETATNDQHYIYLLNWLVDLDFEMFRQTEIPPTLFHQLDNATARGVQVRAMFWDQWGRGNTDQVHRINAIPNTTTAGTGITGSAAAILDNNTLNFGSHHQKILLVKGNQGLISFCGGIDFNPDRITPPIDDEPGSPMHDVHCRITGPAAWDLLQIFIQRWTDHPASGALDRAKGELRGSGEPLPSGAGSSHVQIGRTYGNGASHGGIMNSRGQQFYAFAQHGEQTAWQITLRAIRQARQYIYMENQYLVSMAASNALRDQLEDIQRLIILITYSGISDLPEVWARTRAFISNLGHPGKVSVCYRSRPGQPSDAEHNYVHSKIFIIDDEFTIIGSANCNRRGYTHDSEVVAGIHDPAFARDLRTRLWSEHLGIPASSLTDPIAGAAHWSSPPSGSFITPYDPAAGSDRRWNPFTGAFWAQLAAWDTEIDPDGS